MAICIFGLFGNIRSWPPCQAAKGIPATFGPQVQLEVVALLKLRLYKHLHALHN